MRDDQWKVSDLTIDTIIESILKNFENVKVEQREGITSFYYGSVQTTPFATIVTKEIGLGNQSAYNGPSAFRLNVGVSKLTFLDLFPESDNGHEIEHAVLDKLFPHPMEKELYWVSVLNPSLATFQSMQPLFADAHDQSVMREKKKG